MGVVEGSSVNLYREQWEKVAAASVVGRKIIIVENCSNSLYPSQAKQNHKVIHIPITILASTTAENHGEGADILKIGHFS